MRQGALWALLGGGCCIRISWVHVVKDVTTTLCHMNVFGLVQEVRFKKAVVVMIVDLMDQSGTLMGKVLPEHFSSCLPPVALRLHTPASSDVPTCSPASLLECLPACSDVEHHLEEPQLRCNTFSCLLFNGQSFC